MAAFPEKDKKTSWILGLFIVVGLVMTFFIFCPPCIKLFRAKSWIQIDCSIITAKAVTTYSTSGRGRASFTKVDILYEYTYKGQKFQSDKYGFFDKLTRTYKGASKIAARYPVGSKAVCYVNPTNPSEAALERNFEVHDLLGLIPLIFSAAGGLGLWQRRRSKQYGGKIDYVQKSEIELKPQSRMTKAAGFFVFALVFCASAVFLWKNVPIYFVWMPAIFGLVGMLLLYVSVNLFLAVFNPTVQLKLMPSVIEVG